MTNVQLLLHSLRTDQIARLEGRDSGLSREALRSATLRLQRRAARHAEKKVRALNECPVSSSLAITTHARKRMGQRHLTMRQVYALWRFGEERKLKERNMVAYACTEKALSGMPQSIRKTMTRVAGAALLISYGDGGPRSRHCLGGRLRHPLPVSLCKISQGTVQGT